MTTVDRLHGSTSRGSTQLRLLCVLAHPDDESLALGGILAKYRAEGVETYLVTATRGERGWFGPADENPGPTALARIRERELRSAASVLGIRELTLLDYRDGELDAADQVELASQLAEQVRRIRPDVVVTFDHNGVYGHPDHIAVTRATSAALMVAAATSSQRNTSDRPHAVAKLYHFAWTADVQLAYEAAFGDFSMQVDGVERHAVSWPDWAVSARIDTSEYWQRAWDAIRCHRSQLPGYQKLLDLPDEYHRTLWGRPTFHRVYSLVPTHANETDLFEGLREWRRVFEPGAGVEARSARAPRARRRAGETNGRRHRTSTSTRAGRKETNVMATMTKVRPQECIYSFIGDAGPMVRDDIIRFLAVDEAVVDAWLRRRVEAAYLVRDEFGAYSTSCAWPRADF